jgi:hypothetical protein
MFWDGDELSVEGMGVLEPIKIQSAEPMEMIYRLP